MYCPKCGKENFEGADLCLHCSWVLNGISATEVRPDAKTSGFAITALVLAILSLFTCGLLILPALIFGIIAMVKIEKSGGKLKGKGFAITGLVTPAIIFPMAMMLGILMPAIGKTRQLAQRIHCQANVKGLGCAMQVYANDYNEKYPASLQWCDLLIKYEDVQKAQFNCAAAEKGTCNYAMNKNIEKFGVASPAQMVLLFESKPGWNQAGGLELLTTDNHCGEGCNILFNDGHTEFVKRADLNNLLWTVEEKK